MKNLPYESIQAVAAFVRMLQAHQESFGSNGWLGRAYLARIFGELPGSTLYGLLNAESFPSSVALGMTLYREYLSTCPMRHRRMVTTKQGPLYQYGDRTLEAELYDKIGGWLHAMQLQPEFGSILEYESSRIFVWLDREKHQPRFASGKVIQSWMGRVTRRDKDYYESKYDSNGTELWIYKQKAMDIADVYHWYIQDNERRSLIAKGTAPKLEYAAEEVYRAYFDLVTDDLFKEALIPKDGKEVGIYGNWIPEAEAKRLDLQFVRSDDRNELVFALGYPCLQRDRIITTVIRVKKLATRFRDTANYTLTLADGSEITSIDWHVYKPEQYLPAGTVLQCKMCQNVSPKAFDVRWVRGIGPVCGMSRDHYSDSGLIHDSDFD